MEERKGKGAPGGGMGLSQVEDHEACEDASGRAVRLPVQGPVASWGIRRDLSLTLCSAPSTLWSQLSQPDQDWVDEGAVLGVQDLRLESHCCG